MAGAADVLSACTAAAVAAGVDEPMGACGCAEAVFVVAVSAGCTWIEGPGSLCKMKDDEEA